jgi:formate dehydrogenase maturation protein FdhE
MSEGKGGTMMMNYSEIEAARRLLQQAVTDCPACGGREVFAAVAPPGKRERAVYLRCQKCGQERADLEFYEA